MKKRKQTCLIRSHFILIYVNVMNFLRRHVVGTLLSNTIFASLVYNMPHLMILLGTPVFEGFEGNEKPVFGGFKECSIFE